MKNAIGALISSVLACVAACGQSQHTVWVCDALDCHFIDSSVMGGLRFEDYKVTNPTAVEFDPAQRLKELASLGPSTAETLCAAPPVFTTPAPTIGFDKSAVQAQIYFSPEMPTRGYPLEFMDVQFTNFTTSDGYSSPSFGFRMVRKITQDATEVPQYSIQIQPGNPGLSNVVGLEGGGSGVGFMIDPVGQTADFFGTTPSSVLLRQAIFGVFVNAQSILQAANFTVTTPAPAGEPLWSAPEIVSLAGQAQPWILAAANAAVPLGPPFNCSALSHGYLTCDGASEIAALSNVVLAWGGEYLGLRTTESFNILVNNLRTWAQANAPSVDPVYNATSEGAFSFLANKWPMATPIVMLWPTLRADPALSPADRQTIENWIVNWLVPPPVVPDYFPNDLGYNADSIVMADAIRRGDNATFAFGVQRFYGALNQMRADGSFPLAAMLSACSAGYTNVDLLHLVKMAEMAATQGYDLYSMDVGGKTLETAIEFLLNAYADPALLYQYSMAGGGICSEGNPGDPPDFSTVFGPGSHSSLTWAESYLARFPFSTTAARLRTILGSNISASPFPLTTSATGLNGSCAFRDSYEFQPVSGAKVAIVSGNGQTVAPNQPAPSRLTVRVTDNSGNALAGELVSFAVVQGSANVAAPAQVLTDATGAASASVMMGPASGPVTVTAKALGVPASFSMTVPGPAISAGGIVGIAGSVPAVTTISPGALFSIYGPNFVPAGTSGSAEFVKGMLPTTLLGVCVSVEGVSAPLLDVFPGQINAVTPNVTLPQGEQPSMVEVIVTTGCGTPQPIQSMPQSVIVAAAAPEFFYFAHNANGQNPVAAVNSLSGAHMGPATLGPSFTPAHPGDLVTIYASGFGATNPGIAPGAIASGAAQVTSTAKVTLGSMTLAPSDVLYAGAAPGELISQLNIRIPSGTPAGNQPLQIVIGGIASPPGAFLAIAEPGS
jgi:uncharacterized protein (TIGR03437 family)